VGPHAPQHLFQVLMRDPKGIVITAILAGVQFALAATRSGSVPLPTGLSVSIFSIPAVLAGVLVGVISAVLVGAVFGAMTLALATTPLFQNPIVAIVPRLVFGAVSALVYRGLRPVNEALALTVAGALGPVVNTGLVLLLAAVLTGPVGAPYMSPDAAWDVARTNIPAEAILGAIVTLVVGLAARAAKLSRP
jgi:uncharacterized membrane protein